MQAGTNNTKFGKRRRRGIIKRVLLTEDDFDMREAMREALYSIEDVHMDLSCAFNGMEAIDTCNQVAQDLIILDLMMPVMNGAEVLHELILKDRAFLEHTKVIIISASPTGAAVADNLNVDFLMKPIDIDVFLDKVEECLE